MARLRFGLWYDFRNPPRWRQDPTQLYRAIVDQVVRAEQLGWDDVWLSEHHFIEDDYAPSMLPLACAIAARTERIHIGTSVLLLPLHDPLRVAEDAATVDVMSGGRLELGVAGGYRLAEFRGFDVATGSRAPRMDEAVPLLRALFSGERVDHEGRHYRYRDIELHPRPVQRAPRIWMGGFSEPAARRAGRLADGYIGIGPIRPMVEVARTAREQAGLAAEGFEAAGGLSWLLVARDPEKRWREAEAHLIYQQNLYARWFSEAGMFIGTPAKSIADLEAQGSRIVNPEQACEEIDRYVRDHGVTRFYGWTLPPGLPPEWSDEHLELMAREVMPAFRGRDAGSAA